MHVTRHALLKENAVKIQAKAPCIRIFRWQQKPKPTFFFVRLHRGKQDAADRGKEPGQVRGHESALRVFLNLVT